MLEGLEAINWHELEHAYGEASDVPYLLRNLASADAKTRQNALSELYSNIYHQGTVFEATVYAVPFLIELSQTETVRDRDKLLIYLAHLSRGHSYLEVHQNSLFYAEELSQLEFQAQIQRETIWVKNVNCAVCADPNIYLNLLEHDEPQLRIAASYTLACCQQNLAEIVPRFKQYLTQEQNPQVTASLLLSLSILQPSELTNFQIFMNFLNSEESDLVQLAAAMSLARLAKEKTPPEAIAILIGTIESSEPVRELYAQLPWANSDVVADASDFLSYLGTAGNIAISALINALEIVDNYSILSIVRTLLYLAFNEQKLVEPATKQNLTPLQQSTLEAIARCDRVWQFNVSMANILRAFGLPEWRNKLQAFLVSS